MMLLLQVPIKLYYLIRIFANNFYANTLIWFSNLKSANFRFESFLRIKNQSKKHK